MIHVTQLIIRILMKRAYSRIRPEIGQEECDFVQETRTKHTTFMMKILSE